MDAASAPAPSPGVPPQAGAASRDGLRAAERDALLQALASDDADRIEAALEAAAPALPAAVLHVLREAVAAYDFRAAEELVRRTTAAG